MTSTTRSPAAPARRRPRPPSSLAWASHQRRLAVILWRLPLEPRGLRRAGAAAAIAAPFLKLPCRPVAAAEAEGEGSGDRRRAEDQAECQDDDLIGQAHEGQADGGEQGDDRIFYDRLGVAGLAGRAADQGRQDPRQEQADDDDHRAEDDLA